VREPRYRAPSSEEIIDRQFFIKNQRGDVIVNDAGEDLIGAVIDDESIVKQNLGDLKYSAQLSAGIEQLLHPEIGTAVEATGKFWGDPYRRIAVSLPPIMAVVYAENPYAAGNHVRHLHEGVNGTDKNGRHFNTLDRDAFYWAHETFRSGVQKNVEHYRRMEFTDADREQLQLESATWYSYYGMSMKMVPADYQANLAYREHIINNVLDVKDNPSAERSIDVATNHRAPRPEYVPKRIWKLAELAVAPVTEIVGLVAIGELDPAIREKFGIPFSSEDQKRLDEIHTIAKRFIDRLPDPLRYSPMAYESLVRDRNGHKNMRDRVLHAGLSLGSTSLKAAAAPILKLAA